ncbi:hypothetical protein ACI3L1_08935 [Deinococcus sp. SM5_A1]|uniref:hypothetical protein n=1 Tax=Deinococcus sp. SM5_A1 TaxID=3379094 RepID=UPI003859FAE4
MTALSAEKATALLALTFDPRFVLVGRLLSGLAGSGEPGFKGLQSLFKFLDTRLKNQAIVAGGGVLNALTLSNRALSVPC